MGKNRKINAAAIIRPTTLTEFENIKRITTFAFELKFS